MAKSSVFKKIAVGAAIAGAAGYVAGLLTAPRSGKETRQKMGSTANKSMIEVERQLKELHTELGKLVDVAREHGEDLTGKAAKELKELVETAKDAKEKMRQVLSAVHEGEASDKDLDNAISDAKHAITHIKDFLQK